MIQVVPAIIPYTKVGFLDELEKISSFAKLVQIDISDGVFTSIKTWPYNNHDSEFFDRLKNETEGWPLWESLDYEIHLMVKNPEDVVLDWIHTGATSIVAHIEATNNFQKIIDICKENNVSVGLAIKPSTPISVIEPYEKEIDFIQCMGSDFLGKHRVALEDKAVLQIKRLHALYPHRIIGIDIGVTKETAETLVEAGVTKLISGSAILETDNPEEVFRYFESLK